MSATKDKGVSSAPETEEAASNAKPLKPSTPETETAEMVLTYHTSTGQVIRIHKVNPSGGREELTEEEYASFFGCGSEEPAEAGYDPNAVAFAVAHQQAGFEQGYYHGLIEYEAALTGQASSGYSPEEEAAYNQGVADYHTLVSGQ
jgi:hypothetical protein